MGNKSSSSKKSQPPSPIPSNYPQHCHPNLLDYYIDEKQPFILSAFLPNNSQTRKWRFDHIEPLLDTKYIFKPCRILTQQNHFYEHGLCSSNLSQDEGEIMGDGNSAASGRINVAYEGFVYSLSHEITQRKYYYEQFMQKMSKKKLSMNDILTLPKQAYFSQQQIWKLLKYVTKGLIEWHNIFPYERIDSLMPENIILNDRGNARIVNQYSFPKQSYFQLRRPIYEADYEQLMQQQQNTKLNSALNYNQRNSTSQITNPNTINTMNSQFSGPYTSGYTSIHRNSINPNQYSNFSFKDTNPSQLQYQPQSQSQLYSQHSQDQYYILSSDLYCIGMILIDCMILERGQQPRFGSVDQKVQEMMQPMPWKQNMPLPQETYSNQIKNVVITLLDKDYKKRPNPHDLVQMATVRSHYKKYYEHDSVSESISQQVNERVMSQRASERENIQWYE